MNVLLVEDDAQLAMITTAALSLCGHEATVSATVADAVDRLTASHRFPVVLLDLQLPDGRGEDIVDQLRQLGISIPPIIILSGLPESELADAALRIDAAVAIRKPFSTSRLCDAVDGLIST